MIIQTKQNQQYVDQLNNNTEPVLKWNLPVHRIMIHNDRRQFSDTKLTCQTYLSTCAILINSVKTA